MEKNNLWVFFFGTNGLAWESFGIISHLHLSVASCPWLAGKDHKFMIIDSFWFSSDLFLEGTLGHIRSLGVQLVITRKSKRTLGPVQAWAYQPMSGSKVDATLLMEA